MFPTIDPKFFEQLASNPLALIGKIAEFQRANFEAAREIAENNSRAFQQLATIRDPQELASMPPAILQATAQQNMEILTRLWQNAVSEQAPAPKAPPARSKPSSTK